MTRATVRSRLAFLLGGAALLASTAVAPQPAPTPTPFRAAAAPAPAVHQEHDAVRVTRQYRIAADADQTVEVGEWIRIRGTVETTTPRGQTVVRRATLQELNGGAWKNRWTTYTTRVGAFSFDISAGSRVQTRVFRVVAPARKGLAAATTQPMNVEVVDTSPENPDNPENYDAPEPLPVGYVGPGAADDWTYLSGNPARWNPCQVIQWAYNPQGEAYDALPDLERAFARLAGATGLKMKYVGATSARDLGDPDYESPAGIDTVVAWANAAELPELGGSVVGLGGGWWRYSDDPTGVSEMFQGSLTLDNEAILPGGFDQNGWGQIELHEILHSLGLGHAGHQDQIMFPVATDDNVDFGAGDLTGMTMIGAAQGCLR